MSLLNCVEIEPKQPARSAVIWLHGLGATGADFVPIVPELRLPEALATRFVFPHAAERPVTINGGMVMPSWYDIYALDINRKIDLSQLRLSAKDIKALVDREIARGIDSRRIVIAGFSQGGAVAYETALSYDKPLAGLLALSTYFASHESIVCSQENANIAIKIDHGLQDPMVVEMLGQHAVSALQSKQYQPQYTTYAMQHEVCMEQIAGISLWLQQVLSAPTAG